MSAYYCGSTWEPALERFVQWCEFLQLTPAESFEAAARIFSDEHFGIESIRLENTDDDIAADSMRYLNLGETYATTLVLTDDVTNGNALIVSSWGDWYETAERRYESDNDVRRCPNCGQFTMPTVCDCGYDFNN